MLALLLLDLKIIYIIKTSIPSINSIYRPYYIQDFSLEKLLGEVAVVVLLFKTTGRFKVIFFGGTTCNLSE